MSVYPPLKFVEQMENYIQLYNARNLESVVNQKSIKFADELISADRSKLFHDFGTLRQSNNSKDKLLLRDYYTPIINKYCATLGVANYLDSFNDFMDLMIFYDTRRIWRKNKLSYLLDTSLFENLLTMKTPELAPIDCMTKLPAECFYIDYNGSGDKLIKDLSGTFVLTSKTADELNIVLLHLINSKTLNRELIVTTVFRLGLNSSSDKFIPSVVKLDARELECEDGVKRLVDEGLIAKFIYNFLIYLHAANRDVKTSERTRQNHEKTQTVIKNKFREVKEFEIGFTYGRPIGRDVERIKYIGEKGKSGVAHSPKSSHYRSAHWHHYWVGSGEDKKLVIKWVEGVFVNGGKEEAENVQIHKVK